ncbi:MAG: hypothetical protein OXU64_00710 [Gemmatimonadota bacterium]|nr:hypothetical protein [Gemmatimonadota bacterium]
MYDAFLKSVFADRRMVEILIRRHAPEWVGDRLRDTPRGTQRAGQQEDASTAPSRHDLVRRCRHRLVRWSGKAGDDPASADLTALVLGLARDLSPPDMAEQLTALRRALEVYGTADLEGFMARTVDTTAQPRTPRSPPGRPSTPASPDS